MPSVRLQALPADLPRGVAQALTGAGVEGLLPFQAAAVRQMGGDGGNILLAAPAGAGKTLPALIEIVRTLGRGARAVYLVPTRALAEQKRAEFEEALGPCGWRVVCSTRERPEADARVRAGDFDVLVAVYEKMNAHLLNEGEAIAGVGLAVVDEIQTLADADRGGALDLLVTKLRLSPYAPRIIALAGELAPASEAALADWLGAAVIRSGERPLPLREGVLDLATGGFRYRTGPAGDESTEQLIDPAEVDPLITRAGELLVGDRQGCAGGAPGMLAAAAAFVAQGTSVLAFAPMRSSCVAWARALAELLLDPPAAPNFPDAGPCDEPTALVRELRELAARGVAFHNADLPEPLRRWIEGEFNAGRLRALVSTPTLASGVNLAAEIVLHFPYGVVNTGGAGRPRLAPLPPVRLRNQGGRAGRLGRTTATEGRSILCGFGEREAEQLWRRLTESVEAIPAPLTPLARVGALLDLLAGGVARSEENLAAALAQTFSAKAGASPTARNITAAATTAIEANLVRRGEEGLLRLTGLGEVAARHGLGAKTVTAMAQGCDEGCELDLLLTLAQTAEGMAAATALGGGRGGWLPRETAARIDGAEGRMAAGMIHQPGGPNTRERMLLRTALLLSEWIGPDGTVALEARWRVGHGAMARCGAEFAWLAGAWAEIAAVPDAPSAPLYATLLDLARRLGAGLPPRAGELARLRVAGLNRTAAMALIEEGIESPEAILGVPAGKLAEKVGAALAEELRGAALRHCGAAGKQAGLARRGVETGFKSDCRKGANVVPAYPAGGAALRGSGRSADRLCIEIDLASPGIVRALGKEVRLTPLSFQFISVLAEQPGRVMARDELYRRLWPGGGPEEQQLDNHRRTLLERLKPVLGNRTGEVAEVVRGHGFRLALAPGEVRLSAAGRG